MVLILILFLILIFTANWRPWPRSRSGTRL